ncbi:MAG: response regulator transcription factor [bacterium]
MSLSDDHVGAEPQNPIRVAVVDDHALVRSGIRNALGLADEIQVVGEAADGLAAIDLLEKELVDVLLLDIHMPRLDGLGCLDVVTERWPDLPVVILTVDEDPEIALEVMQRGAAAYVPKFVRPADLASIVRQVASGSVLMGGIRLAGAIARSESAPVSPAAPAHGLTQRELEVLGLVAQGKSNANMARALYITTKTVKYHVTGIFSKLGVHNRTEAAAFAINHGLVCPRPAPREGTVPGHGRSGPAAPRSAVL